MAAYYAVRRKRRKLKTGRLFFLLAIFAFLLLLFFTSRFLGTLNDITDTSPWAKNLPTVKKGEPKHVLVYTVSAQGHLTAAALTASRAGKTTARIIMIPVNTQVTPDNDQVLSDLYTANDRKSFVSSVEKLLQTNIHTFLEIKESELGKIINLMKASVTDAIPVLATNHDVPAYLNDASASPTEQYERRRMVLTALLHEITQGNMLQDILYFRAAAPLLTTNLTWRDMLLLIKQYEKASYNDVARMITLPGMLEAADTPRFLADHENIPKLVVWLDDESAAIPRSQITVEVLNGCGLAGVAGKVAQLLRNEGFHVASIGNADRYDYDMSQVISRTSNIEVAKEVAVVIPYAQLLKNEVADSNVLVTVIVGKDYSANE